MRKTNLKIYGIDIDMRFYLSATLNMSFNKELINYRKPYIGVESKLITL